MPDLAFPKDFLSMALTVSPLRALLYIKKNYPEATFVSAMHFLFHEFWTPPHVNLTVEENLRDALARATKKPDGRGEDGKKLFSADEIRAIMEGRAEMREVLTQETERAVEKGAFGLPWLWVRNGQGKEEPFFGSDRYGMVDSREVDATVRGLIMDAGSITSTSFLTFRIRTWIFCHLQSCERHFPSFLTDAPGKRT